MFFGETYRRERISAGIILKEVAESVGVSVSYLADIERGCRMPPRKKIISKMLVAIGITKKNDEHDRLVLLAKNELIDCTVSKFLGETK